MPFLGQCRSITEFKVESRLGEGTYGAVSLARDTKSNQFVAVKKLRLAPEGDGVQGLPISSLREIQLLRKTQHDNIVKVLEVAVGNRLDDIHLVMEYCEHDMAYLIDNVISQNKPFTTAEADFGLARKFSVPTRPMTPQVVTLWYRAPEVLFGAKEYTTAIDMWAAGCIFAELIRATALMPGATEKEQVLLLCKTLGTPSEKIWMDFPNLPLAKSFPLYQQDHSDLLRIFHTSSPETRSLIKACLVYDPRLRISADIALEHAYFMGELPRAVHPTSLPKYPDIRTNPGALAGILGVQHQQQQGGGKLKRLGDDKLDAMRRKREREDDVVGYDLDLLAAPAFKRFDYK
ncbi:hypothetical protein SmJEL517_g05090 [Synchytrium microbalum]|uniref:Protein kinase domain-containing protein n=1 Tax=Synchytrium microbalum TaxID=1806994 RepID=A0A507BQY7_9FUNG|nr:uncharacterized protein SmJEL517_g05090 [Synchytrium microbalum]TPX31587.1 hypothetical protein SmJEL517_g05090 [Synchytrium microbalum]